MRKKYLNSRNRVISYLFGCLVLAGCASPGVLATYPSNISYSTNKTSQIDNQRITTITLWKGQANSNSDDLKVAILCVPHSTNKGGHLDNACAYNILLEQGGNPDIPALIESFSQCTATDATCIQKRSRLYSYLMKTAHANCLSYLANVFAVKETTDGSISATKDLLTGGSITAAASGSPPVAGGLGLINLLTNSYDKVNTRIFEGATARVLADAVDTAQQTYITDQQEKNRDQQQESYCTPDKIHSANYEQCDVFKVLDFTNGYSNACSLKNGLGVLEANAKATDTSKKVTALTQKVDSATSKVAIMENAAQTAAQARDTASMAKQTADAAKTSAEASTTKSQDAYSNAQKASNEADIAKQTAQQAKESAESAITNVKNIQDRLKTLEALVPNK